MGTRPDAPRTLTQMLREWDDAAIRALLDARPDLAFPVPETFSQLASRATTRHSVSAALDELDAFTLAVAARLTASGSTVEVAAFTAGQADDGVDAAAVEDAVRRLLSLGLLWGTPDQVRPVRAMGGLLESVSSDGPVDVTSGPPRASAGDSRAAEMVDKVGAGSAFEFVRRVEVLVEHCDHHAPRLVRTGGLSQRDVRQLAGLVDLNPAATRQHLEIVRAAGLVGPSVHQLDEVLIPTDRFDDWQGRALVDQWGAVVDAWWSDHPDSGSARLKALVLQAFGDPAAGTVVTAASLRPWLAWQRPRRPHGTDRQASAFLDLAGWTGLTGLGALTSYAAGDGEGPDLAGLDKLLPPRVDHVLVQADLTAVAPGPLTPDTARDLNALADVESRGGATVYRITADSLLRARRQGWTSQETLDALTRHSRTTLPQALEYLIADLDRREPPGAGLAEDPIDLTVGRHRPPARAAALTTPDDLGPGDRLDGAHLEACLAALRHDGGDRPSAAGSAAGEAAPAADGTPGTSGSRPASPLDDLREAVESGDTVWFGYTDQRGNVSERWVRAVSVDDGVLVAEDAASGERLSVAVHRITGAHVLRSAPSAPPRSPEPRIRNR